MIGAEKMRDIAFKIKKDLKKEGFVLIVFDYGEGPRLTNYISTGNRENMIEALKQTIKTLEEMRDFNTPESN